ncbi:hypothetical protein ACFP1Z_21100 [Streptomyces gamaensis]|uniref:Glycerophosphoryl diester phosphodiesterase membrane domain-containing protein n=1 Tax=Streptomyces gamaensis TaxID=1763542 RepID=A0ABW0Z5T9_9ACTN
MNDTPGRTPPGPSSDEQQPSAPEQSTGRDEAVRSSQWAQQQPPGGHWSTQPTAPPPPRQRARADSGPRQPRGGQGRPAPQPAPRPGVIPLRPLGAGEIVEGAFRAARAHWRTAFGVSLAVAVGTQGLATAAQGLWFRDAPGLESLQNSNPDPGEIGSAMAALGVTALIGLVGSIVATAMLTVVVSRAVLGRPITMAEAWRDARPQLGRMCGLLLLVPALIAGILAVGLGCGLLATAAGAGSAGAALTALGGLAALAGGVWLWIRYSLAAPALMLEKQGVVASMKRSAKLVRGAWGRVFGIQLLTVLMTFVVSSIVQLPFTLGQLLIAVNGSSGDAFGWPTLITIGIAATISSALTLPVTAGVTALLYVDQRIRRESLDVELARAAGE